MTVSLTVTTIDTASDATITGGAGNDTLTAVFQNYANAAAGATDGNGESACW